MQLIFAVSIMIKIRFIWFFLLVILFLVGFDWWTRAFIRQNDLRYVYYVLFTIAIILFVFIGNPSFPQSVWKQTLVGALAGEVLGLLALFAACFIVPQTRETTLRGIELFGFVNKITSLAVVCGISGSWLVGAFLVIGTKATK